MPLSQQEAEALARLATAKEGVTARAQQAEGRDWVVLITDAAGEHQITDGPAYNRWDHGSEEPEAAALSPAREPSRFRYLSWALTGFFNVVAEVGSAFHPATARRRGADRSSASRAWAARQTRRGKR